MCTGKAVLIGAEEEENLAIRYLGAALEKDGHEVRIVPCSRYYFIQSERVKISIAFFAGMISLLIVYSLYKMLTEPVICDPVHTPNQTLEPVQPPIPGVDSVNELMELNIDVSAVKSSFQECLQNLEFRNA